MKNKFIILLLILSFLLLVGCNTPVASNVTTIDIELDSIEIEVGEDFIIPINYDGKGDYSDLEFIIADESIISNDSNLLSSQFSITKVVLLSSNFPSFASNMIEYSWSSHIAYKLIIALNIHFFNCLTLK